MINKSAASFCLLSSFFHLVTNLKNIFVKALIVFDTEKFKGLCIIHNILSILMMYNMKVLLLPY